MTPEIVQDFLTARASVRTHRGSSGEWARYWRTRYRFALLRLVLSVIAHIAVAFAVVAGLYALILIMWAGFGPLSD